MGRPASGSKREYAKRYLVTHPQASNDEVVKACRVSHRLVTMARAELVSQGLVPPAHGDFLSAAATAAPSQDAMPAPAETPLLSSQELLLQGQQVMDIVLDPEMSFEDQLRICKRFANDPKQSPQVRLAAMQQYNKIKADRVQAESLGPGEPLTDNDKQRRLSRLLKAVGFLLAVAAFEDAFGKKGTDEPDNAGAAPAVPEAPAEPAADGAGDADRAGEGEHPLGPGEDEFTDPGED